MLSMLDRIMGSTKATPVFTKPIPVTPASTPLSTPAQTTGPGPSCVDIAPSKDIQRTDEVTPRPKYDFGVPILLLKDPSEAYTYTARTAISPPTPIDTAISTPLATTLAENDKITTDSKDGDSATAAASDAYDGDAEDNTEDED